MHQIYPIMHVSSKVDLKCYSFNTFLHEDILLRHVCFGDMCIFGKWLTEISDFMINLCVKNLKILPECIGIICLYHLVTSFSKRDLNF